jgi:hypothetical protein
MRSRSGGGRDNAGRRPGCSGIRVSDRRSNRICRDSVPFCWVTLRRVRCPIGCYFTEKKGYPANSKNHRREDLEAPARPRFAANRRRQNHRVRHDDGRQLGKGPHRASANKPLGRSGPIPRFQPVPEWGHCGTAIGQSAQSAGHHTKRIRPTDRSRTEHAGEVGTGREGAKRKICRGGHGAGYQPLKRASAFWLMTWIPSIPARKSSHLNGVAILHDESHAGDFGQSCEVGHFEGTVAIILVGRACRPDQSYWKKDEQTSGAGRKLRKRPTPVVGKKPVGKPQSN